MLLRYHRPRSEPGRAPFGNFGDELNPWLWPRVFPGVFDDEADVAFFGIGSLLGYPKGGDEGIRKRIVFGTGAAFAGASQSEPMDPRWHVYFVRGPLSAVEYGLPKRCWITDPAILVADFSPQKERGQQVVGFMPHLTEAIAWGPLFREACSDAGIQYLDPRDDVEQTMNRIATLDIVLAEAMHAAIVADALRVPWIAVCSAFRPHTFKWTDWCESMGLTFRPVSIPNLSRVVNRFGLASPGPVQRLALKIMRSRLRKLARSGRGQLSENSIHRARLKAVREAMSEFHSDFERGKLD